MWARFQAWADKQLEKMIQREQAGDVFSLNADLHDLARAERQLWALLYEGAVLTLEDEYVAVDPEELPYWQITLGMQWDAVFLVCPNADMHLNELDEFTGAHTEPRTVEHVGDIARDGIWGVLLWFLTGDQLPYWVNTEGEQLAADRRAAERAAQRAQWAAEHAAQEAESAA